MAVIAGIGTAGSTAAYISGGTTAPGRDFLDIGYPVTTAATFENLKIKISGTTASVEVKVFRPNGSDYDFVWVSETFTSFIALSVNTLTFATPTNVLVGDVICVHVDDGSSSSFLGVENTGADSTIWNTSDYLTTQPATNFPNTLPSGRALQIEANGTPTASGAISITSVADYDCLQRNGSNQATFTIAGNVTQVGATIEYNLDGGTYSTLDASPTTTFTGSVLVTGQQTVGVRISNDTGVTDTVIVAAAACVAAWWQSNEDGRGLTNNTVTPGAGKPTPVMYKAGTFSALTDPTGNTGSSAGSTWPRIAQLYSDAGICLCVANVAIGATAIADWQSGGANYQLIEDFATDVGGLEFTASIGGERDTVLGTAQATIESQLNATINALNTAYGTTHYLTYFPGGDGLSGDPSVVWAAFDNVIASNVNCKFGGDLRVIDIDTGTAAGNDGLHLKQDADVLQAANIRYDSFIGSFQSAWARNSNIVIQ